MTTYHSRKQIGNPHRLLLLVTLCTSLLLQGCSIIGVRTTEETPYTVITHDKNIEIRRYASVMAVETYIAENDFQEATNVAFRRLFNYIAGDNIATNKISMTAPVIAEPKSPENNQEIAMTSPVIATQRASKESGWTLKFVLPQTFTANSAPSPTDPLVKLVELPEKTVAAIRYTGLWDNERFDTNSEILNNWLLNNAYTSVSAPSYAGYDPPWALPFLRRNEVLIEVQP
jgi:SOUL heme-binding protein